MPEGDVVYRAAARLHAALAGAVLTGSDLRWPSLATVDLTGRPVLEVVSAGKHLLMRVGAIPSDSTFRAGRREDDEQLTLHSHLRMEGSWHLHRTGKTFTARTADDVRAVLTTPSWVAVGHRLGMLDLVRTSSEHELVGHLGPDVLGADWLDRGADTAVGNLLADPERAVGDALLDQRVMAGVGTFFMAEALFLLGLSPWTPIGDLPDPGRLVALLRRLLEHSASSGFQVTTGDRRPGRTNYVHAHAGRPCLRCGEPVRVEMIGQAPQDRTAFFCPRCQSGPRPGPSPANRAVSPPRRGRRSPGP